MGNPAWNSAMRVFHAINDGDFGCLDDCVTADFVDHGSPFPLPPGPEGYAHVLGFVHHQLKVRYTLDEVIETPDRIVIRATATGVGTEQFHGPGAEGKPYTMSTMHIYRTEGDRLAEHWGVRVEVGAMRQMGVIAPPQPPA